MIGQTLRTGIAGRFRPPDFCFLFPHGPLIRNNSFHNQPGKAFFRYPKNSKVPLPERFFPSASFVTNLKDPLILEPDNFVPSAGMVSKARVPSVSNPKEVSFPSTILSIWTSKFPPNSIGSAATNFYVPDPVLAGILKVTNGSFIGDQIIPRTHAVNRMLRAQICRDPGPDMSAFTVPETFPMIPDCLTSGNQKQWEPDSKNKILRNDVIMESNSVYEKWMDEQLPPYDHGDLRKNPKRPGHKGLCVLATS